MTDKLIYVINEDGIRSEATILSKFRLANNNDYIVYTDNTLDENGNKKVYASTFDPLEANPVLGPIETEKEWNIIEDILNKLQDNK